MKAEVKFTFIIIESERGWGQKVDEVIEFDTEEEADKYVETHNAKNNLDRKVPDIYWRAEKRQKQKLLKI